MSFERIVPCDVDSLGVLTPSSNGMIDVTVETYMDLTDGSTSGRVMWANKVQAFLTFDPTGKVIIGFTMTDMSPTAHLTEKSIHNILLEI